jgi:hypothetical protein
MRLDVVIQPRVRYSTKSVPFISRVDIVTSIIVGAPVRISHGEKVSPIFN